MTSRSCAAARPAQICRAISSAAVLGEAADAPEQRREILAVHVLHRQERRAVDFVDVVDAADVRVRDLPRHADFGVELGQPRRILVDVRRQELERDRLAELQVVGAIDLAHAAAAQPLDDAVASAEERARLEAAVIDGARRREPAGGRRRRASLSSRASDRRSIRARRRRVGSRSEPGRIVHAREVRWHHRVDLDCGRGVRHLGQTLAGLLRQDDRGAGRAREDVGHGSGRIIWRPDRGASVRLEESSEERLAAA